MSLQGEHFYEFGPYRLEPSERLLRRGALPVSLPPKSFETLLLLIRNSGHVLSKEELMNSLWPDSFVEENNLTQQISQLRRALGEAPDGQAYIETVPRLGYRFVVPVREVPSEGEQEVVFRRHTRTRILVHQNEEEILHDGLGSEISPADPVPSRAQTPVPLRTWALFGSALALVFAAALWFVLRPGRFFSPPPSPRTLAVLPFQNLKPDPDNQFLSHSLAVAIIHRLGYLSHLVVRPSSYTARYDPAGTDPRVVARDLDVQAVLTGSFLKEGGRLRVSAELVDVASAAVLWRDSFDLPYDQLFTVQDRVADNVARGLQLQILPQEAARVARSVPRDPRAYEYYLRARFGISNDYSLSIQLLEKSVALDPGYAPAWMALGTDYAAHANWQGADPSFREKSRAAFDTALKLDPELPEIHVALAIQKMESGELEQGLLALREELRLNPNEPFAHWWLTEAYLYGGMLPQSIAEGELALRLDPLVNMGSTLNGYLYSGEYQKFLGSMPAGESARTSFYRGLCYLYMQDSSRARPEFEHAFSLDPTLLHAKYGRAFLYAIRGESAPGLRYLRELEQSSPTPDGEMLYKLAQAYAALGDRTSSLRVLRSAVDHSFFCFPCMVRDPLLHSLRGDPVYNQVLDLARSRHEDFKRKYS
ncbi:MAG TPA: winged helix-turn-helix domain-containing protein [Candidatus Acidoferrales bacterium]|nr:winged helix-turn-helix domain-containing protein [Candidatus Acidoferrales bacterium]